MSRRPEGAEDSFAALIAAAVRWVEQRRSVPREVAEDAVQEALLQLVELAGDRLPRSRAGWLRSVAEKRLLDADRHRRTQLPTVGGVERDEPAVPLDLDEVVNLRSALHRLDPALREIVVRRFAGDTWRELSARTGQSEDAVRKRFERGLGQLRAWMDGL